MPVYSQNTEAAFVASVDKSRFEALMSNKMGGGNLLIYDNQGDLVYLDSKELTGYYEKHPEDLHKIENISIQAENSRYEVLSLVSDTTGWLYIAGYSASAAGAELQQILLTTGVIILLILAAVGIISIFGSNRVYQPIGDLVNNVKGMVLNESPDEENQDEFILINKGIHTLVDHNVELQEMIERQKEQLTELVKFVL